MAPADLHSDGLLLHASCVAWEGRATLITGASGTGKSSLALSLMAYGCTLVSDDRTWVKQRAGRLIATAPDTIKNRIEARGIGILGAQSTPDTPVVMAIDLDHKEDTRVPPRRSITHIGVKLPLYYVTEHAAFAAAVLQLLKAGGKRYDDV